MRYPMIFLALVILASVQCSKKNLTNPSAVSVEDLILKDNEISGWLKMGTGWLATSESDLFAKIDGAAPKYTQYGFQEAVEQSYQGNVQTVQCTVPLRIFDQTNTTNAKKVFDEIAVSLSSVEDWPSSNLEEAKIVRYPDSQQIIGWKSKYFVELSISSSLSEALEVLKTFAGNVASKIK